MTAGPRIAAATADGTRHACALLVATAGEGSCGALGVVVDLGQEGATQLAALEGLARHATAPEATRDTIRQALDQLLVGPGASESSGATVLLLRDGLAWCVHAGSGTCLLRRATQWFEMTARHVAGQGSRSACAWPHPLVLEAGDRFVLATGATIASLGIERLQELATGGVPDDDARAIVAAASGRSERPRAGVVIADVAVNAPPP